MSDQDNPAPGGEILFVLREKVFTGVEVATIKDYLMVRAGGGTCKPYLQVRREGGYPVPNAFRAFLP